MRCKDLDEWRARGAAGSSAWPEEAQRHLASCARCAELQSVLDGAASEPLTPDLQARIEGAILPGLRAVAPIPSVERVTITLLLGSLLVAVLGNLWLGFSGWQARSAWQAGVDLSLLGMGLLVLARTLADRMMPGSRHMGHILLYVAASAMSLLVADAVLFDDRWVASFLRISAGCWEVGTLVAAVSAPIFWWVLRRGYWLEPISQGAAAGLLAGLVGVLVLEIHCPYLDRSHIALSHLGAAATASLAGAAIGAVVRFQSTR